MLSDYWQRYAKDVQPQALIDGTDLLGELDIEPGPLVGELLKVVSEAQASGEVLTRDEALDLARARLRETRAV